MTCIEVLLHCLREQRIKQVLFFLHQFQNSLFDELLKNFRIRDFVFHFNVVSPKMLYDGEMINLKEGSPIGTIFRPKLML